MKRVGFAHLFSVVLALWDTPINVRSSGASGIFNGNTLTKSI